MTQNDTVMNDNVQAPQRSLEERVIRLEERLAQPIDYQTLKSDLTAEIIQTLTMAFQSL